MSRARRLTQINSALHEIKVSLFREPGAIQAVSRQSASDAEQPTARKDDYEGTTCIQFMYLLYFVT